VLDQSREPMVQARGLRKSYAARRGGTSLTAVHGIDFEVRRGETFGFLGPNGAGKSSTMRMIGCVSPLSGGTLRILGLDATSHGAEILAISQFYDKPVQSLQEGDRFAAACAGSVPVGLGGVGLSLRRRSPARRRGASCRGTPSHRVGCARSRGLRSSRSGSPSRSRCLAHPGRRGGSRRRRTPAPR
jgi:energy-coupling factor transporter ATP-binding protein EcfA2